MKGGRKGQNKPETAEYEAAMSEARADRRKPQPLCLDKPERWVDYVTPPSRAEAEAMCTPCPLYAICRKSAKQSHPGWGIRGGIAWEYGKQVHWGRLAIAS